MRGQTSGFIDPALPGLMTRCLNGTADTAERNRFGELWQSRVERLLLEHWDDNEVFTVRPVMHHQ